MTALTLLAGCSEEPSLRESSPMQWKTCDALFGPKNMTSLRDALKSDDLRFTSEELSVDDLRNGLTGEVLEWYPTAKYYSLKEYIPCSLSGDTQFTSTVEWAKDSLEAVQSSSRWRHSGGDVYVDNNSAALDWDADVIFPCRITGAPNEQQDWIPLELRVQVGALKVSSELYERLVLSLAQSLRDELNCANDPEIPADLRIDR
ncbi:hypothetical protein [Streptomyces sp. NPDC014995]|uniref:hypothetical protein n=1 Tax=Streptomyces sp. NPDC014995 TaxID=3364936 RepID=UPI0036F6373E